MFMRGYEGPITQESFEEKWLYGHKKLFEAKKKRIIEKIITPVGNILFLYFLLVVTYGAMTRIPVPALQIFLAKSELFANVWKSIGPMVYYPDIHWAGQFLICLIPAFVVSIGISILIFGIIMLAYNPKINETTGDLAVDSKELYRVARETVFRAGKPDIAISMGCNVFYIIYIMICMSKFILELVISGDTESLAIILGFVYEKMGFMLQNPPIITAIGLCVIGVYGIFNTILGYILRLMYVTKIPETFVLDTENFYHECNPEEKARIEEEDRILALADEIRARRKKEKVEFQEGLVARYKSIIKRLKIGCVVLVTIGLLIFSNWVSKNVDFNSIWQTLESYTGTTEITGTEASEGDVIEE